MEILLNVVLVGSFAIFTLALAIRMLRRTRKEPEMLELTEEEVDLVLLGKTPQNNSPKVKEGAAGNRLRQSRASCRPILKNL